MTILHFKNRANCNGNKFWAWSNFSYLFWKGYAQLPIKVLVLHGFWNQKDFTSLFHHFLVAETWVQFFIFLIFKLFNQFLIWMWERFSYHASNPRGHPQVVWVTQCISNTQSVQWSLRSILQSRTQEPSICISIGIGTKNVYLSTRDISPEWPGSRKALVAIVLCQAQNHSISGLSGSGVEFPWDGVSRGYHPTAHWTSSHSAASYYS